MRYLFALLAVLLNIGVISAQEVTDSTSTGWEGGTDIGVTPGKPTGKVTSLSLSQNRLLLAGGQTAQLVAIVNADAANKSVTWSVADNSIATVSSNGLISAVAAGQTVVTATTVDGGLTAQCLVTVKNNAKVYVERITLDTPELEMYVGEVRAVTPTVYPENATDKTLKWETRGVDYYNPALPDENHVFTAYKPGVMEMKLYPNDGSETYAVCKITVKDRPLTRMSLPNEIVLNINEMKTLKPEVTPELFQMKFKWTVGDPSVAYVTSSGRITGVKAGTTTVTATALDGTGISATSKVTVTSSVASMGYSGWILERGEDVHPWTARCFHEAGYYEKPAPDDSKGNKWYSPDYDDSSWYYAYGPLKHRVWPGGGERRTGYGQWEILDYSTMSIRQKFYLPDVTGYDFKVFARVYLSGEVYINGHRVYITDTGDHHRNGSFMAFIDPSYLVMGGENTIAIIGYPCGEEQYLDYGIHYERNIPVTRLLFRQKQLTMTKASSAKLEAILKPAEATRQSLIWSSSDESVAVVHQDGTVVSLMLGTAIITATTTDGTNLSAQCTVTVTDEWGEENEVTVFPWSREVLTFHQSRDKDFITDGNGKSFSELGFDETGWAMCRMPFAPKSDNPNFTLVENANERYFVRQHFVVPDIRGKYVVRVHCRYNDYLRVYCNGVQLDDVKWNDYDFYDIPVDLIHYGEDNIIAISIDAGGYVELDNAITLFKIVPVTSVEMSNTKLTLNQEETTKLSATVLPDNAYNRKVKWTSSEPTIATVDQDGNVMGMGEGKAIITATSLDGTEIAASCEVTVSNMKAVAIWIKDCGQNTPWNAKYQYCRTSDELYTNGPTNDGAGRVWTAKDYDDSAWGTVKGPIGHDVGNHYETYWPDNDSRYYLRETFTVKDLASYTKPQLFLAHDDGVVVWVNGTKVHEQGDGNMGYYVDIHEDVFVEGSNVICIQVSEGGGSAYIDYGVSMTGLTEVVPVSGITLDKTTLALKRNEKSQLTATISPDNAYYKDVEWTSSDPEIVVVDENGNIKGLAAGEAVITVNNKHGKLFAATCKVTVTNEIAPVKAGEWVIAKEDEWQARILSATTGQALYNSEPTKDADGNKWTDFNYDDAKWAEIISPMDKEHGYFPDDSRYYVRSKFAVGDLSSVNSMRLWMAHDDEAQVYINGILVAYFEGAGTGEITLPKELFVKGDNIICVNIHQGGGDAYLDFALMGSGDEAPKKVSGISFDQETYTMSEGKRRKILPTITPQNVFTDEMVWSSSNPAVAKVADDGTVTAVSLGMAVISAVPVYGEDGVAASYNVEVIKSTLGGDSNLPNVSFEFNYNACEYDEVAHAIRNHEEADLGGYNLQLSGNIPTYDADAGCLFMNSICQGWIDRWNFESTSSGQYFYRSGSDDMTVIFKVAPDLNSQSCDFIANRGGGYNYMVRVDGNCNRFYLHTGTAYQSDRSIALTSENEQVLVVRVNGSGNYILLDNLTTGESLKINDINWGGNNNVFKLFYNDDGEYFMGKFFWVYYSKEYLSDEQVDAVMKYNNDVLPNDLYADMNKDGVVNITDVVSLVNYIATNDASAIDLKWVDMNGDGVVNVTDVVFLTNYISKN
ncbi:MAG: Ig-like domain-containing protein [Bacteroidales bacterium]|nr:Ig-like domain-containing protein [Bacteroidales bacterium]